VAVIEDVITTGGSALRAIEAVRAANGIVAGVLALVDREEVDGRRLKPTAFPSSAWSLQARSSELSRLRALPGLRLGIQPDTPPMDERHKEHQHTENQFRSEELKHPLSIVGAPEFYRRHFITVRTWRPKLWGDE